MLRGPGLPCRTVPGQGRPAPLSTTDTATLGLVSADAAAAQSGSGRPDDGRNDIISASLRRRDPGLSAAPPPRGHPGARERRARLRILGPRKIPRTGDDRPVDGLWRYILRMTGWHQAWICLLAVAVSLLNLVPIELQRRMIDDAIAVGRLDVLIRLAVIYVAVILVHKAAKVALGLYQGWLSESAVLYTRGHLLRLHGERARKRDARPGEAVSIINAEADKLAGFVGTGPSQTAVNLAMLAGVLGYMLMVEPRIALLGVALLVPQVALVPLIQRRQNALIEQRLSYLRTLGEQIAAETTGTDDATTGQLRRIYCNRIAFLCWKHLMKGLLNLFNQLAPLGVLLWAGWMVIQGETTVGVVVAFISGFERISGPVRELLSLYRSAQHAVVQHRMIADWM